MTTCASCKKSFDGDILYTSDARAVCPACFDRADVVDTLARRTGPRGLLGVALVAGLLPFFIHITSSESVNGQVTRFRDWSAISCGLVAVACATYAVVVVVRHEPRKLGLPIAMLALGTYQLLYGFGAFA